MTREQAVQSLVRLDAALPDLQGRLHALPWDWEGPALATVVGATVAAILKRHAAGVLTDGQVQQWAELVECRDDIEFSADAAVAVFLLANPSINGTLADVAPALLARLS